MYRCKLSEEYLAFIFAIKGTNMLEVCNVDLVLNTRLHLCINGQFV
jgi:hypothetical protein